MSLGDFTAEFLQEASELNDRFNVFCHQLAHGGDPQKLIDHAFRIIHTLKGTGASVGLKAFAEDLHQLEEQLDQMRKARPEKVSHEFVDQMMLWDSAISKSIMCLHSDRTMGVCLENKTNKSSQTSGAFLPKLEVPSLEGDSQANGGKAVDFHLLGIDLARAVKTSPLFYRSFLLSRQHVHESLAWSFVSLMQLGVLKNKDEFAAKVLDILHNHCNMPEIHRVCLVKRLGLSAEFIVISSATSDEDDALEKQMIKGYRCFVDKHGSVFNIPKGTIRTIDVTRVMESYKRHQRPPQKTVKRLYEAGYRSGAMIPLHNRGFLDGLLFLNSKTSCLVEHHHAWYVLMAELSLYASRHLQEWPMLSEDYYFMMGECQEILAFHVFSPKMLEKCCAKISSYFDLPPIQFEIVGAPPEFMVSHGNLAYLLATIFLHKRQWEPKINIHSRSEGIFFECELPLDFSHFEDKNQVMVWRNKAKCFGMNMIISNQLLCFVLPLESKIDEQVAYSAA